MSGALELVKWLAFAAMVCDHVDLLLFDRSVPWLAAIGRFAFPAFALAFGIGLARSRDPLAVFVRLLPPALVAEVAWQFALPGQREFANVLVMFALCAGVAHMAAVRPLFGWLGAALLLAVSSGLEGMFVGPLLVAGGWLAGSGLSLWGYLVGGALCFALAPAAGTLAGVVAPLSFKAPWRASLRVPGLLAWGYAWHLVLLSVARLWL